MGVELISTDIPYSGISETMEQQKRSTYQYAHDESLSSFNFMKLVKIQADLIATTMAGVNVSLRRYEITYKNCLIWSTSDIPSICSSCVIPNIPQGLFQGGGQLQYLQRLNIGGLGEKTEVLVVVTDWPWSNAWYSLLPSSTIHFRFFPLLSALKFTCISWARNVDHHRLVVFLLSGSEYCNCPFIVSTGHGNSKRCTSQLPEFQASSSLPTLYRKNP